MKQAWIVDDDEEMTRAISLMLKVMDWNVVSFYNARAAAQALLSGKRPNLMILDINMPEVTGIDLLEFMRRRAKWRRLPVIMLSSEAAETLIDKALSIGADGYLTKPIIIEELERIIADISMKYQKG
jgi:two-component system chemotaxis response regulator CheY